MLANINTIKPFTLGFALGATVLYFLYDFMMPLKMNNAASNSEITSVVIKENMEQSIECKEPENSIFLLNEVDKPNIDPVVFKANQLVNKDFVKYQFDLNKLNKYFPNQALQVLKKSELKGVLIDSVMNLSKNNEERVASLAALKLLDESHLPEHIVEQIVSELPHFLEVNESENVVEALMLIEDDVKEAQLTSLLALGESEHPDIRIASMYAIANADRYKQNKSYFENLYNHDESQMIRDIAHNILVNEYF